MASNFYKLPISFFVGQHFSNKTDGAHHQYFHLYLIAPFSTYVVVLMGKAIVLLEVDLKRSIKVEQLSSHLLETSACLYLMFQYVIVVFSL